MRKSELKPCPFCGGEATFVTSLHITGEYAAIVMCERCNAKTDSMRAHDEEDAEVMAAACWNARAERTCEPVKKFSEESPWPRLVCSECGRELHWDDIVNEVGEDSCELQPYCGCGARVVKP